MHLHRDFRRLARAAASSVAGWVVLAAVGCVGSPPPVVRGQMPDLSDVNVVVRPQPDDTPNRLPPLSIPPAPAKEFIPPPLPVEVSPFPPIAVVPPPPPAGLPPVELPPLPTPPAPVAVDKLPPLALPTPPAAEPPSPLPAVGPVRIGGAEVTLEQIHGWVNSDPLLPVAAGGCATCGTSGCNECEPFPRRGLPSRIVGAVYDVLCCPDPCYQPKWHPLADAAFFTNSPRPVSHTRLREEYTNDLKFPDRSEFFWARADGNGKGPRPTPGAAGVPRVDFHQLSLHTEAAANPGFGAFFTLPYRSVNPTFAVPDSAAGFADLSLGTKSVLFDSELLLLTLQFKTTLPTGQPNKGLGTGHVSLEPALLVGLRTSRDSYLQAEIAEWIPIAGDPEYSGAFMHYHLAFNRTLWQPIQPVQLVGTVELHGYSLQDGSFTDPDGGTRRATGTDYLQVGAGLRLFFCDKYDFGVGTNFGVTGKNSLGEQLRAEFRVRY